MPEEYIMVQNLPLNSTSHDLHLLFSKFGKIKSFHLKKNFFGGPALFQVRYASVESAKHALREMNRKRYNGKVLYIKVLFFTIIKV
jgi:RNA recognition motif-containing protein